MSEFKEENFLKKRGTPTETLTEVQLSDYFGDTTELALEHLNYYRIRLGLTPLESFE